MKPISQPKTSRMLALTSRLSLTILSMSLAACETKQTEPLGASKPTQIQPGPRQQEINRQLAARCPTPGRLTAAELNAVADDLVKGVPRHWQRTAAEYDRLDSEAVACRTGRKP